MRDLKLNNIYLIYVYTYEKDLALNNQQGLIWRKTQETNHNKNLFCILF